MPVSRTKSRPKKARAKPKQKPQTLAPRTEPTDQPGALRVVWLSRAQTGGVSVTEDTALRLAAVWACVKVISEDIACLGWPVLRELPGGGNERVPLHPVDWLLNFQPNPETSKFTWREITVAHALTWGNGYAEIERDALGRPVWLWQLTPDRCCLERDQGGNLMLRVDNFGAEPTSLPYEDVFHLKGLSFDGLVGYPVIRYFAALLGGALSMDHSRADFWANDSTPGGFLSTPNRLGEMAIQNLVKSWEARHKGPKNRRNIAVLEEDLKWEQTGLPPETAQLVEQLQLSVEDICRIFRVAPHKVMHILRAVGWSTLEQTEKEHVTDCLTPWVQRLEGEANIKLFGRKQRGAYFTKMNLKSRLRGDTAAQTTHLRELGDRGVYDVDEMREYLDLNPLPKDGDKRAVQRNMTTLAKLGEDPKPATPAAAPSANGKPKAQAQAADLKAAYLPVLEDACGRILRRASHRVVDAGKRLEPSAFHEWFDAKFVPEHAVYALEALSPVVLAFGKMAGAPDAIPILRGVCDDHMDEVKAYSRTDPTLSVLWPDAAPGWAGQIADRVLALAHKPAPPRVTTKTVLRDAKGRITAVREEGP